MVWFLLLILAAAAAGYWVLSLAGLEDADAWAVGRTVGPFLCVLPAWWCGVAGAAWWPWVFPPVVVVAGGLGFRRVASRRAWRAVAVPEAMFWGAGGAMLALRWGRPEIVGQEKLMDLGILASMIRSPSFPPPDMWLAGESLPYYYWGGLPWATALRVTGVPLEIGYNVIVAIVAGLTLTAAWSLASGLIGGRRGALVPAAFLTVFAGTLDGFRQLVSHRAIGAVDLWASSRQIEHTITEFPLFTFWLGDLHPHLLSMPLAFAALALGLAAGRNLRPELVVLAGILFGITWAANPWALPPTFVGVALLVLSGDGTDPWPWPWRSGAWRRWVAVVGFGVAGAIATAAFHLDFEPPSRPIKAVFAWTPPPVLLLYAATLLVPAAWAGWVMVVRRREGEAPRETALFLSAVAVMVVGGAALGRPTAALVGLLMLLYTAAAVRMDFGRDRPALALTALGLFLFVVPEFVYLEDGYGADLHRMNTVFKAYIQGWMLLAVTLPVLLRRGFGDGVGQRVAVTMILMVSLPHLVVVGLMSAGAERGGVDGFGWMGETDRALIHELREQPAGRAMVEGVGGAYSEYGRLSSGSGVPTALGWANHELVWRGSTVVEETERRRRLVDRIYTSGEIEQVRRAVADLGIDVVAIGDLEMRDFEPEALAAVRAAGRRAQPVGAGFLVHFGPDEDS
jgi:YYY domain-containing protein